MPKHDKPASGHAKRLKRAAKEQKAKEDAEGHRVKISKWFHPTELNPGPNDDVAVPGVIRTGTESPNQPSTSTNEDQSFQSADHLVNDDRELTTLAVTTVIQNPESEGSTLYSNDAGSWPHRVPKEMRDFFLRKTKPTVDSQFKSVDFSGSSTKTDGESFYRRCTLGLFTKTLHNGQTVDRDWLCYSPLTKKVYCFYCKLILSPTAKDNAMTPLLTGGYNSWKNATRDVDRHERSNEHHDALRFLLSANISIDKHLNIEIERQYNYWLDVLRRVVAVVKFLSSRGLAFRGHEEKIGSTSNGNYLGTLELLAQFDPFLKEHIERYAHRGKGHVNYLSSTICDEMIQCMASSLYRKIIDEIKTAKYYSISIDSTPDISHTDQLTIIFRYVKNVTVTERFLKFIPIRDHTGKGLATVLLDLLREEGISILDCRGQSYDNASNMSGRYTGVQAQLIQCNPLAEYVPCYGHSLNLVGQCAADACSGCVHFFTFVNALYSFFSASTHRWQLLLDELRDTGSLTLKKLSDTRWSAHADSVRAVRTGYDCIRIILENIADDVDEKPDYRQQAKGFVATIDSLETGCLLATWYEVLERFNKTSKSLQSSNLDLNTAAQLLRSLATFVLDLREKFDTFEEEGKELSGCNTYKNTRKRRRNRTYDDGDGEETILSPRENFRTQTFVIMIDQLSAALTKRQNAYSVLSQRFGFLGKLGNLNRDELKEAASTLLAIYTDDLDEHFENELHQFVNVIKDKIFITDKIYELQILEMFDSETNAGTALISTFPNIYTTLRIYLSIMVTNCSGERSFSALARIKNHLRSTMGQDRMGALALLCIEANLLDSINLDEIIKTFASRKARKKDVV